MIPRCYLIDETNLFSFFEPLFLKKTCLLPEEKALHSSRNGKPKIHTLITLPCLSLLAPPIDFALIS